MGKLLYLDFIITIHFSKYKGEQQSFQDLFIRERRAGPMHGFSFCSNRKLLEALPPLGIIHLDRHLGFVFGNSFRIPA